MKIDSAVVFVRLCVKSHGKASFGEWILAKFSIPLKGVCPRGALHSILISSNLANANSTRTAEGGPYKRKDAVFTATSSKSFASVMDGKGQMGANGVEVTEIREDITPPRLQFEPSHPDANPQGYVAYPNVNVVEEMADMITATRAYEANLTASRATMSMQMKALELSK